MTRTRPTLLAYVVAASFVTNLLLTLFVWLTGPESPSIFVAWLAKPVVVQSVVPGSPSARAGILAGDVLVAANGRRIHDFAEWQQANESLENGRVFHLTINRAGALIERDLTLRPRPLAFWISAAGLLQLTFCAAQLVYIGLAVLIIFARPGDHAALFGALLLGVCGSAVVVRPEGYVAAWRHAPSFLQPFLWINELSVCVGFGILMTFLTLFPKPLPKARWILLIAWIPDLFIQPWFLRYVFDHVYFPGRSPSLPEWLKSSVFVYWIAYPLAAAALAVTSYWRLSDANERRRVRLICAGLCVTVAANLPRTIFVAGSLRFTRLGSMIVSPAASIVAALATLSIPTSFAVAITRDRLFDIRLMIRQGVRHAIARGFLLSLAPSLAIVLAADLAFHADQPLSTVLQERGWIYASIAGIAVAAHLTRKRWLDAIDRHFFREKYNSEQLLRQAVHTVRDASDLPEASQVVVTQIEAALHPEFVVLFLRDRNGTEFRAIAGLPEAAQSIDVRQERKVVSLMRLLGKSLDTSGKSAGWLEQLPPEEIAWIARERVELFIPIVISEHGIEALLLLGRKKSDELYSQDDLDVLEAIAAGLALRFRSGSDQKWEQKPEVSSFRECPTCGMCQTWNTSSCQKDGSQLLVRNFARVLAGRYRLEQRIGSGGMGAVYEAADLVLGRAVAAKLVREELVDSPQAIARFEREARIAAKFAHPNVVTIFDFGVEGGRPFIVMELLRGNTLRAELQTERRMNAGRMLSILSAVCAGLEAAHQHRLIHRDLKPENIFLTQEGVKILDFGLSKLLEPPLLDSTTPTVTLHTRAGTIVGTLDYMAPEQLAGTAPSISWDIWALGVISYEMLTGARPFVGPDATAVQTAIRQATFVPLSTYIQDGPQGLSNLYERAFSLDTKRRPSTPTALLDDLSAAHVW